MRIVLTERDYRLLELAATYGSLTPAQATRALTPICEWAHRYIDGEGLESVYRPEDNLRARMSKLAKAETYAPLSMTRLPTRKLAYSLTPGGADIMPSTVIRRDPRAAVTTQDGDLHQQLTALGLEPQILWAGALETAKAVLLRLDRPGGIKAATETAKRHAGKPALFITTNTATREAILKAYPAVAVMKANATDAGYYYARALDPRQPHAPTLEALGGEIHE